MSFWKYILLFFSIFGLLMAFFLLSSEKEKPFRERLLLVVSFLFVQTVLLTFYYWLRLGEKFYSLLLVCAFFTQLLLFATLIYLCITHPDGSRRQRNSVSSFNQKQLKYEKTGLSESFSFELKSKLEHLMATKKPYLNHELRLDDIAELLDISRHHASQVINENFKMSFYDYINQYRIEEAKNKLSSSISNNLSYSISDIAYQCGFNNRVSFYKAFKKITRTTPTEFIDNAA
ncbi:helix-turn-helix domain-containing protein [Allomuricauda sp. CP2A]|uniref:helix-turn-helix domain-containing protein n=1 Tax=Allomuricauda sp. CP2A TaxID=1848189 RepID=UPI0009F2F03C|nr:AraC family transcriptional regulator [Muricauda sp. CP2A]